jgi:hypothetical protein
MSDCLRAAALVLLAALVLAAGWLFTALAFAL